MSDSHGASSFPVSSVQDRILVLDEMNPQAGAFNLARAFLLRGEFDPARFQAAVRAVVAGNEALRTAFHVIDGRYRQVVRSTAEAEADVEAVSVADRDDLEAVLTERARRPFDSGRAAMLRIVVAQLPAGERALLVCTHRLVADEVSFGQLLRDLSARYRDLEPAHADLPGSPGAFDHRPGYCVHAQREHERLCAGGYREDEEYWTTTLADAPQLLALPTDLARPQVRTAHCASESTRISASVVSGLRDPGRAHGADLDTMLLTAFGAFLSRLSGMGEIVVGVENHRARAGAAQDAIGPYTDVLPVRVDLSDDLPIGDAVTRVGQAAGQAVSHADIPFGVILSALSLDRELSYDPVVQATFRIEDEPAPDRSLDLRGARIQALCLPSDRAAYADLAVSVAYDEAGSDGGLAIRFDYRTDLFHAETMRRWVADFAVLIDGIAAADPGTPVTRVPMVTAAERVEMLESWNATEVEVPDRPVHALVSEVARLNPDRAAVGCRDAELTFRELDLRSDRLGWFLRESGVGPGTIVALCLGRSLDMAVAVLAVLKAGGAYVPLDPAYPSQRLKFMIDDSQARIVVTQAALAARLPETAARTVVVDGADSEAIARAGAGTSREPAEVTGADAAYIIYTSGSTGKPKGVVIDHRSLTNLAVAQRHDFGVTADDRVLQFASFSFDVSVSDMFFTWTAGAFLQIAAEDERLGPALQERLRESRITTVTLPPAAVSTLTPGPGVLPDLRTLVVGGEAFTADLIEPWARERRVIDAYGPTESTVWTALAPLGPGEVPLIGRPLANLQVYVLDSWLEPVPVGVAGVLYVAGEGVARGYAGRPQLTAERFVPNPFGPPGSRLYDTGDLVRWREGGLLEFAGRVDDQVKVRGYRIELGEIEEALRAHGQIAQAVVIARRDAVGGGARLVAYTRAGGSGPADDGALREWLGERLPAYMVPEVFVPMDVFPTTRAGKVDRSRLPDPPTTRPDNGPVYVAPRTSLEERIAAVWADVLRLDRVGVNDDFFALGGNSLSLLALRSGLTTAEPPVDVRLADLFRFPTVALCADFIQRSAERTEAAADRAARPARTNGGDAAHAERAAPSPVAAPATDTYEELRAALSPAELDAAVGSVTRLRSHLAATGGVDGQVVMVAYGGGKDSSFALAFARLMQLVSRRIYGDTFRMRVVTNRHAGMPKAVMENIERVYQALKLYEDPECELLCVDGDTVSPFRVDLPLPDRIVERNRTDILMTGHRAAGDGRPTFCNACNLNMVRAFALAGAHGAGADVIVTGDSPEEQRAYLSWINKLARAFKIGAKAPEQRGFNRVLGLFDGIAKEYFTDIHGAVGMDPSLHRIPHDMDKSLTFFSIYQEADYASGSHWRFLTEYLGFVFDDIAFSFSESDCGNPGLMAHLRGLKCEHRYGRSYAEGLDEYVEFAVGLMRQKDFPEQLVDLMHQRYSGEGGTLAMRAAMTRYAQEAYGLSEEQLVCMIYAPFVDRAAALGQYLAAEQPDLAEKAPEIRRLLEQGENAEAAAAQLELRCRLERMTGLSVGQLAALYHRPLLSADPPSGMDTLLSAVRIGDPHKSVITTRHDTHGPAVPEVISGR